MAKKSSINKSQAVRDYMAANPDDGPTAVAASLKKQKIIVKPNFVSNIKMKDKAKGRKPATKKAAAKRAATVGVDDILVGLDFVAKCGGPEAAQEVLKAAIQVSQRVKG